MPTYDYVCDLCGHAFEQYQGLSEPLLRQCPKCNRPGLRRLIGAGAGVLFKGSGFYETDYKRKSPPDAGTSTPAADAPGKSADKRGDQGDDKRSDKRSDQGSEPSSGKPGGSGQRGSPAGEGSPGAPAPGKTPPAAAPPAKDSAPAREPDAGRRSTPRGGPGGAPGGAAGGKST